MYNGRIALTGRDILEKDFKIDTRGYRLQEVDKFLDIVIHDYNEYDGLVKDLVFKNNNLIEENESLKNQIRDLRSNLEALKYSEKEVTNMDLIRRVSQLEKIILGKENN